MWAVACGTKPLIPSDEIAKFKYVCEVKIICQYERDKKKK